MILLIGNIDLASVLIKVHRGVTTARDQCLHLVGIEIYSNDAALLSCNIHSRPGWNGDIAWSFRNRDLFDLGSFDVIEDRQISSIGNPELVTTIGRERCANGGHAQSINRFVQLKYMFNM